jgi:hypothetical protein
MSRRTLVLTGTKSLNENSALISSIGLSVHLSHIKSEGGVIRTISSVIYSLAGGKDSMAKHVKILVV